MGIAPELHPFLRLMFVVLVIALAITDGHTMRLPNKLTLPLLAVGLLNASLWGMRGFWYGGFAALGFGGAFWLIYWFHPDGMGLGDVKFAAGLAAFLGFPSTLLALLIASVTGTFVGGVFLLRRQVQSGQRGFKARLKEPMAFGPYLGLGALIALFWGNPIMAVYGTVLLHLTK